MSKYLGPAIIGIVVAIVVAFLLGFLFGRTGEMGTDTVAMYGGGAGVITAYILANLAGNRAGRAGTADDKARALASVPPAGKALLFLYREGFVAKLAGLNISVDGREVVQLKSPRFSCVTVGAGPHTIKAGFGGLAGPQSKAAEATITAPAGGVLALRMTAHMGALQGAIAITEQTDMAAVKRTLARMEMTQPEVPEVSSTQPLPDAAITG